VFIKYDVIEPISSVIMSRGFVVQREESSVNTNAVIEKRSSTIASKNHMFSETIGYTLKMFAKNVLL
jgi:hypothetical protein